ncbi:hypothetical protein [Absidia glauca]|uniref:V-SNARE coiled-coil homology domain-containing protein n=1 Tax=Absidia glauca TaxID=4829 RepID=A0A168NFJ8_ABSGL|nr:hypothetical protein [Absidia glauca]
MVRGLLPPNFMYGRPFSHQGYRGLKMEFKIRNPLWKFMQNLTEPYDPYIPTNKSNDGGGGGGEKHPSDRTASVQQQVDDVVNIMQDNIDKVMNRGERIDDLRGKAEDLNATAGNFKRGANQVRKRMWWKDLKWKIIIGVTILAILGIIIGSIVGTQTHKNDNSQQQPPPQQTQADQASTSGSVPEESTTQQ